MTATAEIYLNPCFLHDFVIGEIACGNLKNRQEVLILLSWLPKCEAATHKEVLFFIDQNRLMGGGVSVTSTPVFSRRQHWEVLNFGRATRSWPL
jgi:hypothetical protein